MPPLYDYRCEDGHEFERIQSVAEHTGRATCDCGKKAKQVIRPTHVMADIEPYRATVTGERIGSRSAHREYLKRNGLVEIGTDPIRPRKAEPLPPLREDLDRTLAEIRTHGVAEDLRERR